MSTKKKTLSIFDTAIVGNPLSERKKGNIFDKNTSNFSTDGLRQILGFVHSPEHIREPEEYQVSDLAKQKLNRISGGVFGFPYRQVLSGLFEKSHNVSTNCL